MSSKIHMNVIDHASQILRMFEIEPSPLDRLIERYFKRHRDLRSGERKSVADAAFGVARWRGRLDGLLNSEGVKKPTARDRVGLLLHLGDGIGQFALDDFPGKENDYYSFPDFLYAMFCEQYGADAARELAQAINRPIPPTLRVNTLKVERAEAMDRLADAGLDATPTSHSPYGIRLAERKALGSLNLFSDGLIEIQDEASQLAVLLSSPSAGARVLDACAGAGGKSLMLAMLMRNDGNIVATDIERRKLRELRKRAKRAGVKIISARDGGVQEVTSEEGFDLVFVDAPCTGTGTIGRNPDLKWRIDRATVESRVRLQKEILETSAKLVRPNGRLVYATCSLLRQENQDVVESFLSVSKFAVEDARGLFESSAVNMDNFVTNEGYYCADPRDGMWDGFFAVVMRNACG